MNLTCDKCKHLFPVTDDAVSAGEVKCPKCKASVSLSLSADVGVDLGSGGLDEFLDLGGMPDAKPAEEITSPKPKAPEKKAGGTDDSLMGDFSDFDALFDEASKSDQPPVVKPAPPKAPSGGGVEDLLSDLEAGAASHDAVPPKRESSGEVGVDELFSDLLSDSPQAKTQPGVAKSPSAAKPVAPKATRPKEEVSQPDQDLEELFSEVSSEAEAPASGASEESGDAMAAGLGIEYAQRKKKIPKMVLIIVPAVIVVLGLAAVGVARFTSNGLFGWKLGKRSADGYEPPSASLLKELNRKYLESSALLSQDSVEGYTKAILGFREILKQDIRHSPTDVRLAEALLLLDGNVLDPSKKKELDRLVEQGEKFHPGALETLRVKARISLAVQDLGQADSLARRALASDPKDPDTMTLLGEISLQRMELETAIGQFTKVLEIDPVRPRARHFLALTRLQQGQISEAENLFRSLVEASPPHPSSEVDLWRLLYSNYGKVQEAKAGLENLVQTKAAQLSSFDQGRAWRYLAEIAEANHDVPAAIAAMEKAIEKDPLNHANGFHLGRLYLQRKEFDKAEAQFGRAESLSPQTPEYMIYRGNALRELNKSTDSMSELTKALEKVPNHVEGLFQLGLTQMALGRNEEAIASLENVLKNDPKHLDSMVALGDLYLKKDNFALAQNHLRAAIAIAPKDVRARNTLGEVFLVTRKSEEALSEFKLAIAEDAENVTVLANLGKAYLALGKTEDAATYFQKALSLDSTRIDTQVALGELQHKKKEYTKALETYRRVLEVQPKDYATRVKLARVLIDQQAYQEAITELQEAAKYSPDYFPTRLYMGVAWRGLGSLDSSMDELNKAIQLRPEDAEAYYQITLTHIYRNDAVNADRAMEKAIGFDKKFIAPIMALGDYYSSRNVYSQAAEYYLRAEKIEPNNAEVLLKLAESYRKDGKLKVAKAYFQKTIKIDKKNSDAYIGLGQLADGENLRAQAVQHYLKAQGADPDNPQPYYYLGFAYKDLGQNRSAVLAFRKYLKLDPQSKDKDDIEDLIRALSK